MKLDNGWRVWGDVDSDGHLTVEVMRENEPNENIFDTFSVDESNMFRFSTIEIVKKFKLDNPNG